jgi:U3 small nucleolar RNA-associated protein 20
VLRHDDLYPHLRMSLLSHQQKLRALVLRLLASKVVQKHSATDMVKSLLVAEDVSLDVQGVRERLLRMNRLVQNVPINGEADAEICTRWLTGTTGFILLRSI